MVTAAPCRKLAPIRAAKGMNGSSSSGFSIFTMLAALTCGSSAPTTCRREKPGLRPGPRYTTCAPLIRPRASRSSRFFRCLTGNSMPSHINGSPSNRSSSGASKALRKARIKRMRVALRQTNTGDRAMRSDSTRWARTTRSSLFAASATMVSKSLN